jgi:hypothetical protein
MNLQILNNQSVKLESTIFLTGNEFLDNNGQPTWVHFLRPQFNKMGFNIKMTDYKDIDKSKPFIVNLFINSQNWFPSKKDILLGFPENLIKDINQGKAYLLINNDWESWSKEFLQSIYKKLKSSNINPLCVMLLILKVSIINYV